MSDPVAEVRFDATRQERLGLPEAVLADVKSPGQLAEAVRQALDAGGPVLVTRMSERQYAALPEQYRCRLGYDPVSRTALASDSLPLAGAVAEVGVLTAGSADVPVAREAIRTLACHGHACVEINDVGVAGLWRVMEHREVLVRLPVLIVCAGMEGALFSVIAGLVPGVVIAVPTSTGYGVAAGGRAALHAALASCAPGVAVSNVDNGYGAACLAIRVLSGSKTGIRCGD